MLIPFDSLFSKHNLTFNGVLHIGANDADERNMYDQLGMKRQVWFEADPEIFTKLCHNLQVDIGWDKARAFNYAVGNRNEDDVVFHVASNGGQSSSILALGTHKIEHPDVLFVKDILVRMRTIDGLVRSGELDVSGLDLLNIDVQGYELEVLRGMKDHVGQFKAIYIETNKAEVYVGCPLIEEIDNFLLNFGFDRIVTRWAPNKNWGDSLYAKRDNGHL